MDNGNYLIVGKFDISKYDNRIKTTTNKVILTGERLKHILDEHPEVIKNLSSLSNFINNPDMVCIQNDKKDTIWIIKKINSNLKITIRLNTIKNGRKGYINSIIQMQYMHNSEIIRNIKSGKVKILYEKDVDIIVNV